LYNLQDGVGWLHYALNINFVNSIYGRNFTLLATIIGWHGSRVLDDVIGRHDVRYYGINMVSRLILLCSALCFDCVFCISAIAVS